MRLYLWERFKVCLKCGYETDAFMRYLYCPRCGTKLVERVREKPRCFACGEEIHRYDRYCPMCGFRVQPRRLWSLLSEIAVPSIFLGVALLCLWAYFTQEWEKVVFELRFATFSIAMLILIVPILIWWIILDVRRWMR